MVFYAHPQQLSAAHYLQQVFTAPDVNQPNQRKHDLTM